MVIVIAVGGKGACQRGRSKLIVAAALRDLASQFRRSYCGAANAATCQKRTFGPSPLEAAITWTNYAKGVRFSAMNSWLFTD
jgi:hypothetical protein